MANDAVDLNLGSVVRHHDISRNPPLVCSQSDCLSVVPATVSAKTILCLVPEDSHCIRSPSEFERLDVLGILTFHENLPSSDFVYFRRIYNWCPHNHSFERFSSLDDIRERNVFHVFSGLADESNTSLLRLGLITPWGAKASRGGSRMQSQPGY